MNQNRIGIFADHETPVNANSGNPSGSVRSERNPRKNQVLMPSVYSEEFDRLLGKCARVLGERHKTRRYAPNALIFGLGDYIMKRFHCFRCAKTVGAGQVTEDHYGDRSDYFLSRMWTYS